MSDTGADQDTETDLKPLWQMAMAIFVAWFVWWGLMIWLLPDWTSRGQFGDMFGAVNSLFTGLAFAGAWKKAVAGG